MLDLGVYVVGYVGGVVGVVEVYYVGCDDLLIFGDDWYGEVLVGLGVYIWIGVVDE